MQMGSVPDSVVRLAPERADLELWSCNHADVSGLAIVSSPIDRIQQFDLLSDR